MSINDPNASPAERLAALRALLGADAKFPDFVAESNNHVHTSYSFSPYTPAAAALRAREAGLQVVGSVDHDSAAGAAEMAGAAQALGMGVVTGFECRVYLYSAEEIEQGRAPLNERKLNNPDTAGIAYMTVQAIPASQRDAVAQFLAPIREARLARTARMVERANEILGELGASLIDLESDIVDCSQYRRGGTVTERHLLAAMARKLVARFGIGQSLVDGLASLGINPGEKVATQLAETDNPHLIFDLLGVMKAEFLGQIYIVPNRAECPTMAEVIAFAQSIGAIACYAYLGDVTVSPTGDKKAEKFEDEFLEQLFEELRRLGMPAITYMPPRNTAAQMARIAELAAVYGLIEVSGVDINTPRQQFNCPELQRPELAHLNLATWAMVAHELLAEADLHLGLCAPGNPIAERALDERIKRYAKYGKVLAAGEATLDEVVTQLKEAA